MQAASLKQYRSQATYMAPGRQWSLSSMHRRQACFLLAQHSKGKRCLVLGLSCQVPCYAAVAGTVSVQRCGSCWRTPNSCWMQQVQSRSGCDMVSAPSRWHTGPRWWLQHSWWHSGEGCR